MCINRISVILISFIFICSISSAQIVIDHSCTNLSQVPESWINQAKSNLHIAYQHTSHGSQITTGIGMINTLNPGGLYDFLEGGGAGISGLQGLCNAVLCRTSK